MSTAYQTTNFAQNQPTGTGHGLARNSTHLHATSGAISTWAVNDTIAIGYLPSNAVVVGAALKASAQLDSNGSPTLALDLGIVGAPQLFKAAVTTVGHAAGASVDIGTGLAAAGYLYKNTTGAKVEVIVTVHTASATAAAGTLEVDVEYYVEDTVGSTA